MVEKFAEVPEKKAGKQEDTYQDSIENYRKLAKGCCWPCLGMLVKLAKKPPVELSPNLAGSECHWCPTGWPSTVETSMPETSAKYARTRKRSLFYLQCLPSFLYWQSLMSHNLAKEKCLSEPGPESQIGQWKLHLDTWHSSSFWLLISHMHPSSLIWTFK